MKKIYVLISASAAYLILLASCQLLFNPDFSNKSGLGPNDSSISLSETIGPGAPSISGTYIAYSTGGYNIFVAIDGGTYTQASTSSPNWVLSNLNLPCGPHQVSVQLKNSSGDGKANNSFIYNVPAYVALSPTGSDGNSGNTPSLPIMTIQTGVNLLATLGQKYGQPGYIYVAAGTYTPNEDGAGGLNLPGVTGLSLTNFSNINLIGGWINNFQNRGGISILNESTINNTLIDLTGSSSCIIDGFTMEGSGQTGIAFNNSFNNGLNNLIIYNNGYGYSSGSGGITLNNSSGNTITASIIGNNTHGGGSGGGISIIGSSHNNIINGLISNNVTANFTSDGTTYYGGCGGGIYLLGGYNNVINAICLSLCYSKHVFC